MKSYFFLSLFSLFSIQLFSQSVEEVNARNTVDAFFEAFHAQDSLAIKKTVSPNIILQSIGVTKNGEQEVRTESFNDLVRSITSIPDSVNFQEKLLDYQINIDGSMANVWTPYEFWLNDKFHHCGVNSFQLFKKDNEWKIIYLIDTRRKNGCQ